MRDRVGLSWRPELAAGILANLERIDVLEVIADDYFEASSRKMRALCTLARQVPVALHGVGMGLGSCLPVEARRLERMARLADRVQPIFWSEHLAFVRSGGFEIGHLAAPPRTARSVEGAAENFQRSLAAVGAPPLLENIATLIDPPGSDRDEISWVREIVAAAGCDLLLDLHNLYANALNFRWDPRSFLEQIPLERVGAVHLAGGKWVEAGEGAKRLLDDHLHDVPDRVYDLLEELAARAPRPLTVILERDGNFPFTDLLLAELDRARWALQRGRARARTGAEMRFP